MQISDFKGITQYHDGIAVSDYTNVIPLTNSCIDRQGEALVLAHTGKPLETFVDSTGVIYAAYADGVYAWQYIEAQPGQFELHAVGTDPSGLILQAKRYFTKATFCESATKPSQVYFCDGYNVFYWNTTYLASSYSGVPEQYKVRLDAFEPQQIPIFTDVTAILNPAMSGGTSGTQYGWWPEINDTNYDLTKLLKIESIAWFDNRLVLKERNYNTIYLTAVDPSRWILPSKDGMPFYPLSKTGTGSYLNSLLPNYYSSTASSATLVDVVAFAGQLYLLNEFSIEIWSATGNDLNPIQHNSQATLYYGGRSPVIIADTLYLLCKDTIHNDFIAAISQGGQFQKISNIEIERRLQKGAYRIRPLSIRDQSMIVVYSDDTYLTGYSCTGEGKWWCVLNHPGNCLAWTICNRSGQILGISTSGAIVNTTDDHRKYCDGTPIPRWIRGAFIQCAGRKILREVEVVCDTGAHFEPAATYRPEFYLRVSFDRGLGFGPYMYRKMGSTGTNDRVMVWRNCGSGNSILLEFGTSNDTKFQIYGIRFELT